MEGDLSVMVANLLSIAELALRYLSVNITALRLVVMAVIDTARHDALF